MRSGLERGTQQEPGQGPRNEGPVLEPVERGPRRFLFARAGLVAASVGAHEVTQHLAPERPNLTGTKTKKKKTETSLSSIHTYLNIPRQQINEINVFCQAVINTKSLRLYPGQEELTDCAEVWKVRSTTGDDAALEGENMALKSPLWALWRSSGAGSNTVGQLGGGRMRREKRAAFGKVSVGGQASVAAVSGDGDGDEGGNGEVGGGDAPREPRCRTVCSPGTRTQSEVLPRLRSRLSAPAGASGRLGRAAAARLDLAGAERCRTLASPQPHSHRLPRASELRLQLPALDLESQPH